jgi:hypothetical protein
MLICVCLCILASSRIPRYDLGDKPLISKVVLSYIGILYGLFEIGGVPGNNSMMNSMPQWGGIPSNSSGKISRNSWTILIFSRDVPLTWLSTLIWFAEIAIVNSTVVPFSRVKWIALLAHTITLSYFLNQSMPRIISMPWESMLMRFNKKSNPPFGNTNCQAYMLSLHFTSRWANNHGVHHDGDGQIILCNKLGCYEGMRCSRIKQNYYRVRVCEEHTQYNILGLLGFLDSHMADLATGEILLPLRAL